MPRVLHVVDGESTGGTIRVSGLARGKAILGWNEALYSGPVPAKLSLRQLSRVRSRYWTKGKRSTCFDKRDAALRKHVHCEHIALWFGPDCVLCQLSLIQVLSWFHDHGASTHRLSWVALHGGELQPSKISDAYATQERITSSQLVLAERAWRAFREPTPAEMFRLIRDEKDAIPGLRKAFLRLLQEYPSVRGGLSRLETLLLRYVQKKGSTRAAAAMTSVMAKETVGDVLLADMLRNFVKVRHPLLEFTEPFRGSIRNWRFNAAVLKLTDVGKRVLAGKADHIAMNAIDRWIGGVHLQGHASPWRWDDTTKRIVEA